MAGKESPQWTEERKALLKKLWEEGVDTADIAVQLSKIGDDGYQFTKRAVIGKAGRMELGLHPNPPGGRPAAEPTKAKSSKNITAGAPSARQWNRQRHTVKSAVRPKKDTGTHPVVRLKENGNTQRLQKETPPLPKKPSLFLSAKERRERGLTSRSDMFGQDLSATPSPSDELPIETIRALGTLYHD